MIYPEPLQEGDTIGMIAPAGPPNMDQLSKAIHFFENMGLTVKLGEHIDRVYGYLAGTDEERLADFHTMIENPAVQAIIFTSGGYGTGRIASSIDYELLKKNPKIIWGYSDITYLHTAISKHAGLITFHGPMASTEIGTNDFDIQSAQLIQQLFEQTPLFYTEDISPLIIVNHGETNKVRGRLTGGNLTLITSTIGTSFEIETDNTILLIEDIDEPPYKIDSMLNQLELSGKLANVAAIIIGEFTSTEPKQDQASLTLTEVFNHYFANRPYPVIKGFKIGHCLPHFSIPLGAKAVLNASKKILSIEPGVELKAKIGDASDL